MSVKNAPPPSLPLPPAPTPIPWSLPTSAPPTASPSSPRSVALHLPVPGAPPTLFTAATMVSSSPAATTSST
ncbi:hypothetical protein V8C86DRAFT_3088795 [Haematococcus lacustris]